jgi:hypothetical protein
MEMDHTRRASDCRWETKPLEKRLKYKGINLQPASAAHPFEWRRHGVIAELLNLCPELTCSFVILLKKRN